MSRRILPYGDRALLAEVDTLAAARALYDGLRARPLAGVVDIVPAARSVTTTFDPRVVAAETVGEWLRSADASDGSTLSSPTIAIDVDYSGPDLDAVASHLGIAVDEVVALHTGSVWTVAFSGFAPGFGYLVTNHERLAVPRRAVPRPSVPAGSVGLADEFTGVYPRSSPGGWQLIGTSDVRLWLPDAESPALLTPGASVRFRSI